MPASFRLHLFFMAVSFGAAVIASLGILVDAPLFYATVPGLLGAGMMAVSSLRFLRSKADLAGFVATTCGFVFYQAFQLNPVMLPEFTAGLAVVPQIDQAVGLFLANFTTGMLLLAFHAMSRVLHRPLQRLVPDADQAERTRVDPTLLKGFMIIFVIVGLPNVLFGKVVVGAFLNILHQRSGWASGELGAFAVWGGPLGASLVNVALWATSLFFVWIYLLRSRYRVMMWLLAPFVVLWTGSVAFQGSRTYLVMIAFSMVVFIWGDPKVGLRAFRDAAIGLPLMLVLLQIASFYRTEGLQAVDFGELAERIFEIRGNEGASSQMDGLEYFRTELLAKDAAPNPVLGFVRGLIERPIEGLLMPVPRALFPWKPLDETASEYTLFYQNVRLGTPSDETFMGASPGLMGRELIRYGFFGPLTILIWLGSILALADRLYAAAPRSDFHRIFAAVLIAFLVAQMRDWVPMWVLPFLPAMFAFVFVAARAKRRALARTCRPVRAGGSVSCRPPLA